MIDKGEVALATIGIVNVIGDTVPKVGKLRLSEMANYERHMNQLATKVVKGELEFTPMDRPHSYDKLLKVISELPRSVNVDAWIDQFDVVDGDLATKFAIAAQHALTDLAAVFPRQTYTTLTGPKALTPPTTQLFQFYSVLDIVNDPVRVYPLIAVGGISPRQRDALKLVFPGISAAVDNSFFGVDGAVIKATAAKTSPETGYSSFQVPQKAAYGLATWQGKRIAEFKPPQPGAAAPPATPKKSAGKNVALDKATQTQKIDAGV